MSRKIEQLRAMADKIEKFSYMRAFTPEELAEKKDQMASHVIEIRNKNQELKKITKDFKEEVKPIKDELDLLTTEVKQKAELVNEECFVEIDRETGVAKYFSSSTADLVGTRPLNPSER